MVWPFVIISIIPFSFITFSLSLMLPLGLVHFLSLKNGLQHPLWGGKKKGTKGKSGGEWQKEKGKSVRKGKGKGKGGKGDTGSKNPFSPFFHKLALWVQILQLCYLLSTWIPYQLSPLLTIYIFPFISHGYSSLKCFPSVNSSFCSFSFPTPSTQTKAAQGSGWGFPLWTAWAAGV